MTHLPTNGLDRPGRCTYGGINYTVRTGQNGYSYDTHQYCIGIAVTEQEQ